MTDYDTARAELRAAELALMQQREAVAEMRRALPHGPAHEDYVFASPTGAVRLSELFTAPDRSLVLYHFMFGKTQEAPCPMCSMWTDGWNATADHLADSLDLALVSAAPIDTTMELVEKQGWTDLRWVSAADNSFKTDVGGEDENGNQLPFLSVWRLVDDVPTLTYSGGAHIEGDHWRGVDLLSPVWHFMDLTREGRGDWFPSLDYAALS